MDSSGGDSIVLRKDGTLVSWGDDDENQISDTPKGSNFIAIAAGRSHSIALKEDGTIESWGLDESDQVSNMAKDLIL